MTVETVELSNARYEALPWEDVESSNVRRLAFKQEGTQVRATEDGVDVGPEPDQMGTLYVDYGSEDAPAIYAYRAVPFSRYQVVRNAHSVGGMIHKAVKDRFATLRVLIVPEQADDEELAAEIVSAVLDALGPVLQALSDRMENLERGLSAIMTMLSSNATPQHEEDHGNADPHTGS